MKIKLFLILLLSFLTKNLFAQTTQNPFYTNGKIYVVVAVILIIFTGIIIFLISIDRRLTKTEKELKENNKKD
ncbi:MAG: CcmD family protein [Bacteroidetes bacterium]|nr:CcmD family protein [Bacteroidota bacterium]